MRRDAAGRVTSTIVAAVSVVAIAAALVGLLVNGSGDEAPVAGGEPTAAQSSPAESPRETQSESASAEPSSAPEPKSKSKSKSKPKPEPKPEAEPEPAVPSVYVEVYNMTSVSGLASSKAAQLQDAGWQVVGIDNWRGNIPASTVYYPDGMADEATQLANSLGISRTRGAVAPMKFDRLTVILTTDAV